MQQICRDRDIRIEPFDGEVRVTFRGRPVAVSTHALALHEGDYPVRYYIPASEVDGERLTASQLRTNCPFKGSAGYFHLQMDGQQAENAVWYYPDPCPGVEQIKDHLSFWGDEVEITTH